MAKKGQKFSKYSDALKQEIMKNIVQGMSIRYVAKQYNIPSGTIFTWTDKKNHPEKISGFKPGRKKESNLTKKSNGTFEEYKPYRKKSTSWIIIKDEEKLMNLRG